LALNVRGEPPGNHDVKIWHHAAPTGRPRIDWQLITNLPVDGTEHAIEKLRWYALRWKIEVFHKTVKSGCRAEQARLRTAERLVNLIAVYCIVSWRIFWMTMMNRASPQATPLIALTATEIALLDRLSRGEIGLWPQPISECAQHMFLMSALWPPPREEIAGAACSAGDGRGAPPFRSENRQHRMK
jgi:hypothetical protein